MKTATISVIKARFSEYVDAVSRGEDVIVTKRGRPVAHIIPVSKEVAEDERIARLVARGVLRPPAHAGRLRDVLKRVRPIPVSEGAVLRAIREDRDEGG
jgi:prevent-host-death family protein